jgi:hypothetical protein
MEKSYDLLGFLAHASSFNNNYFEGKKEGKGFPMGTLTLVISLFLRKMPKIAIMDRIGI